MNISFSHLKTVAGEVGLSLVGVTGVSPLTSAEASLIAWQNKYAGDLHYMKRDPDLFISPEHFLPKAKVLVMVSVQYERTPVRECPSGYGRVARYAWGKDYHKVLKKRLNAFIARLQEHYEGIEARSFTDAIPLLERGFAARAGIGFIGKNSLLITPYEGSFSLLGGVLLTTEVTAIPSQSRALQVLHCGSCHTCIDKCPTSAIVQEYVVDARKCISAITIEKRGILSIEERISIGEWIFGCDVCQEVCPYNHRSLKEHRAAEIPEFSPQFGVGPLLSLKEVLAIKTDETYVNKFQGTPLMRPKREGLLRNAAVVAANTGATSVIPELQEAFAHDESIIVRRHSLWALLQFAKASGDKREWDTLIHKAKGDEVLREEILGAGQF